MPKISVIIPVYNGEKYLVRCWNTLKSQTFKDWQAIFVDDGSKDKTGKILEKYAGADKRVVVIHKKNMGVSSARNDGIKRAKGEYIHFMDVDDEIDADYYENMLKFAGDSDIVCSGFVSNSKHSSNLVYKRYRVLKTLFGKLFWGQSLIKSFVWRYLFKTEFIKKNKLQFDTSLISQEDAVFVLNALLISGQMVIVPNTNYHYLFNADSALNKKGREHRKKLKQQYKIGKQFRKQYAKDNNVMILWRFRKIIRLFF